MRTQSYDLIVIGAGALGTFHAYWALQQGLSVLLIEKNSKPQGATVRNFGQVVPSGMNLKWQNYGRESLVLYKSIQAQFDITIRQNGSVYLASNEEEVQLIEELHQINKANDYESELLTKEECINRYAGLNENYCKAGLFFPQEVTVEPRAMIHRLHQYLTEQFSLDILFDMSVIEIEEFNGRNKVVCTNGQSFSATNVILCNGSEFKLLYPNIFNASDLEVTKLQMLQTVPQKQYQLNGSILTGLTIRRYEAFHECPSWHTVKAKEDSGSFEKKYGIHILFKQATDGSVIIGDSHEYADAKEIDKLGFDLNMSIDEFMIQEAKKIISLPTYEIQNRWAGYYSQCKTQDIFEHKVSETVHIVTGIGGKGMTGSAGFAKESILKILN